MLDNPNQHRVFTLVYDGLCTFEFGISVEAFALERPELGIPWYDFQTISCDPSPIRAAGGIKIEAESNLDLLKNADTIIVPGWKGCDAPVPEDLVHALKKAHERGCRLISICSGVFVIAATGLLNKKTATTHWRYTDSLSKQYPSINVEPDILYNDTGNNIFTSAGSAAGIDLCLHIIRLDHGPRIANAVAKRFVLPAHREGGQIQFIEHMVSQPHHNLAPLFEQLLSRISESFTVPQMAAMIHMSPRTLIRHFKKTTGLPPHIWLTSKRIKHACGLLETSATKIDNIAIACGFNTPETFRHHFRKQMGISPSRYRKSFSQSTPAVDARFAQPN